MFMMVPLFSFLFGFLGLFWLIYIKKEVKKIAINDVGLVYINNNQKMLIIICLKIWLLAKHAYFCNPCIIFISSV